MAPGGSETSGRGGGPARLYHTYTRNQWEAVLVVSRRVARSLLTRIIITKSISCESNESTRNSDNEQ